MANGGLGNGRDILRQAKQEYRKARDNDYPEGQTSRKEWWDAKKKADDKDTAERVAHANSPQGRIERLERSIAALEYKRLDMGLTAIEAAQLEEQIALVAKLRAAKS